LVNRNALTEFLGQAQASGILRHDGHGGSRRPFALRDLEEGEKAVITHIEEVMAHLLIGRVAAIAGTGTKTGRYLHGMDERHTEHFDVKVDRRLHVVSAKREVVDAPGCR